MGNGLLNLGFFDGHAKAVKGSKVIADDLYDLFKNSPDDTNAPGGQVYAQKATQTIKEWRG